MNGKTPFSPSEVFEDTYEWIGTLHKITKPLDALRLVAENDEYFGYDPYYADIRNAIMKVVRDVLDKHGVKNN